MLKLDKAMNLYWQPSGHWSEPAKEGEWEGASSGFPVLLASPLHAASSRPSLSWPFPPAHAETRPVFPSSPVPGGHGVPLSRAVPAGRGPLPSAVPGSGPWGRVHQLLHPRLCLPRRPLPAQRQLLAPHSVPLPGAGAALRPGSTGSAGLLQQLVGHQPPATVGEGLGGPEGGQAWTHTPGVRSAPWCQAWAPGIPQRVRGCLVTGLGVRGETEAQIGAVIGEGSRGR